MIGYCPHCDTRLVYASADETIVCHGCGEWWHIEFLNARPRPAR
jgi:uncharacterized protein YbaR (Trm112 family)